MTKLVLTLILAALLHGCAYVAKGDSPTEVITDFYRAYLPWATTLKGKAPTVRFSKDFQEVIKKNQDVCAKHAKGEICGWGGNGDVFLDAQDFEPVSFEAAGTQVTEVAPGRVRARFNIFPKAQKASERYIRDVTFVMVHENGHWVVDDIYYDGKGSSSVRKLLQTEIIYYLEKK